MSTQHIATAAFVKVSIGSPSGNRVAQLIQRDGLIPQGVDEAQLERLTARGLIAEVEVEVEVAEPADTDNGDGDGDGSQALDEGVYKGVSVKDLKAEIENRNTDRADDAKVVPAEPGNRPQIVAALLADDNK